MATHPLVSIIIPCFNGSEFLEETLKSVEGQTYSPLDIILVDDGSTDDTREIAKRHPQVRYQYQENQGISAARNAGIKVSRGEYLLFLDHDDNLLPRAVELGVEAFQTRTTSGFVFGRKRLLKEDGTTEEDPIRVMGADFETQLRGHSLVPPSVALFSRKAVEKVGGFDRNRGGAEDYDLYLRITRSFPVYCHNELTVEYRRHANNVSSKNARTLVGIFDAMDNQKNYIRENPHLREAFRAGKKHWIKLFGKRLPHEIVQCLKKGQFGEAAFSFRTLLKYPQGTFPCPNAKK